jgi:broad specificity phosphatase PhoE
VYETPQELRERIWKIKDLLQEYRKKYKKIAVVSHYNTITSLIAKEYDPIGKAVNIPHIPNASPYYLNIAKLLKIK